MDIFFQIMFSFLDFLKYPIIFCFIIFILFFTLIYINVFVGLLKGKRFKKGEHKRVKKHSFFRRIFIDLPFRVSEDMFSREPDTFRYQGVVIFEGRQGRGKTIAMIEFARQMQMEYPKAKCLCNINYKKQDLELNHWKKLVDFKNGRFGVIAIIDETQNWFSSNQSKDFPPEMLQVITQNRKNRRVILGTAQNFYLLAKAIRSQATEVRRCTTLLGALTIVRKFEPILDSDGNVREWKSRGMYFFIHDKELRESYDTYHVVETLSKSGFQPQNNNTNTTNIYIKK